jgi:pyruvate formate lyase activating enzyme
VYTGNISHPSGEVTYCSSCHLALVERDRYELLAYRLTADGCCPDCGTRLPGRYDAAPGHFGPRRIPVRLGGLSVSQGL